MAIRITYLGHSGFLFSDGAHILAVDPFLTGNPVAKHRPEDIECGWIGLTHGHADHVGDSLQIAKANDATVIAAFELATYFEEQGHAKVSPGNPGGKIETDFGWIAFTQAFHSSSYEGRYMGMPCGLVFRMETAGQGFTVYHMGDTTIFGDLKLIGEIYQPSVVCVPIGDRFTMGPELASRATDLTGASIAIPIHYNTWPGIAQDPADFQPTNADVWVMEPGDIRELP